MEVKFNKYLKILFSHFRVIMHHHAKLKGHKYLIQNFHSNMNDEIDGSDLISDIDSYL